MFWSSLTSVGVIFVLITFEISYGTAAYPYLFDFYRSPNNLYDVLRKLAVLIYTRFWKRT